MATEKSAPKKQRRIRKSETVRQKAETVSMAKEQPAKPRRVRRTLGVASQPFRAARRAGKREIYLPLPDNKVGRFLNKRRHFVPRYFRESFKELKLVTWPDRQQTTQLTIAVFIFAIGFGVIIAVVDFGLDRIFKLILVK
jgi:preprotein translocase SecE subunit